MAPDIDPTFAAPYTDIDEHRDSPVPVCSIAKRSPGRPTGTATASANISATAPTSTSGSGTSITRCTATTNGRSTPPGQ